MYCKHTAYQSLCWFLSFFPSHYVCPTFPKGLLDIYWGLFELQQWGQTVCLIGTSIASASLQAFFFFFFFTISCQGFLFQTEMYLKIRRSSLTYSLIVTVMWRKAHIFEEGSVVQSRMKWSFLLYAVFTVLRYSLCLILCLLVYIITEVCLCIVFWICCWVLCILQAYLGTGIAKLKAINAAVFGISLCDTLSVPIQIKLRVRYVRILFKTLNNERLSTECEVQTSFQRCLCIVLQFGC